MSDDRFARIKLTGGMHGKNTRVLLDGVDISRNVFRVELVADAEKCVQAIISVYVSDLDVEMDGLRVVQKTFEPKKVSD